MVTRIIQNIKIFFLLKFIGGNNIRKTVKRIIEKMYNPEILKDLSITARGRRSMILEKSKQWIVIIGKLVPIFSNHYLIIVINGREKLNYGTILK